MGWGRIYEMRLQGGCKDWIEVGGDGTRIPFVGPICTEGSNDSTGRE